MTVHIDLSTKQFEQWIEEFPEQMRRALEDAIPTVTEMAKGLTPAPGSTGELAESVRVTREGYALHIEWTAPYAQWVEAGAEPHIIRARDARALKFMTDTGEIVYRQSVHHPGYEGWHFLQRVADLLGPVLAAFLERQLQATSRGL